MTDEHTPVHDYVYSFGDVGYVRVASTGYSNPENIRAMLARISKVPVTLEVQPSRFAAKAARADEATALLAALLSVVENWTVNSYCEECDRHAPKSEDGTLVGPIPHTDECAIRRTRAFLDKHGKEQG